MIGDPNWLYSTIAQSSAAIVAIVGGFITASVLMLTAEKRSLTNQRKDKNAQLNVLKKQEKEALEVYETMRVNKFFNAIAADLKKEDELPSLELLIRNNSEWKLNLKILKREYENLSIRKLEAREFIEQHSDKIGPTEFTLFDEWFKQNELDISAYDYDLLEEEYNKVRDYKRNILKEEQERNTPPWLRGAIPNITGLFPILPSPQILQQKAQYTLYQREKEDRRLEDAEKRIAGIRYEMSLVESDITNLDSRLSAFSYPPNLGWGLFVLLLLAIFGITIPVLVIFAQAFSVTNSLIVIISFILALAAVFAYIYTQIRTLRRK